MTGTTPSVSCTATTVVPNPQTVTVTFDPYGNSSPFGYYTAPAIGMQQTAPAPGQTVPPAPFAFPIASIEYSASSTHGTSDTLTVTATDTFPVAPPSGGVLLNGDRGSTSGWSIRTGAVLDPAFTFTAGLPVTLKGPTPQGLGQTAVVYTDSSKILGSSALVQNSAGTGCITLSTPGEVGFPFAPAANSTYYVMLVRSASTPSPQATAPFTIVNGSNEAPVPAITGIDAASNISFGVNAGAANQPGTVAASAQNWSGLPEIPGKTGVVYLTVQYTGSGPVTLTALNPPTFVLLANVVGTAFTAGTTYSVQATLNGSPLGSVQSVVAVPSTFPGVAGGEVDFTSPLAGFTWNANQTVGIVISR